MPECYMCNDEGNTREHVPPRSFFPDGQRNDPIIVPSCEAHNNDNSKDVEYVRTLVVTPLGTNSKARKFFQEQPLRALKRNNEALQNRTFSQRGPIEIQSEEFPEGVETNFIKMELDRFQRVFDAIARGLYLNDFNQKFVGSWMIFSPNFFSQETLTTGIPTKGDEAYSEIFKQLERFNFEQTPTSNPEIFSYFSYQKDGDMFYRLVFFEGFVTYAVSLKGQSHLPN